MVIGQGESECVLTFRLDPRSGVPAYLQLVHQVEDAVRLGRLVAGDRLPTVREVVSSVTVNPNTVAKAYRELEYRGISKALGSRGTFIAESAAKTAPVDAQVQARLQVQLDRWMRDALAAGMELAAMRALFELCLDATVSRVAS